MLLNKRDALAAYLSINAGDIKETKYNTFEANGGEYLVYTNDEADEAWEESLDEYIETCVLIDIPRQYWQYFDYDGFKSDCSFDGRGAVLATYDGDEGEQDDYYIYRVG